MRNDFFQEFLCGSAKRLFHGGAFAMPMEKDSSHQEKSKHRLTLYLPVLYASIRNQQLRKFLELNFGTSIYTPQELSALEHRICVNGHKNCHLHITRGEFRKEAFLHEPPGSFHAALLRQQEKNLRFQREHFEPAYAQYFQTDRSHPVCTPMQHQWEFGRKQKRPALPRSRVWRGPIPSRRKAVFQNNSFCQRRSFHDYLVVPPAPSKTVRRKLLPKAI